MFLGSLPYLALDRSGIALLAAIFLIIFGSFTSSELVQAIDWSTIAMLFGLMIVSAQFYFSGFYALIAHRAANLKVTPRLFLLFVILISGLLSAALINDIVCLALTPLFTTICLNRGWKPLPFLLGLVAASNIGSAMTVMGNPQNILISETLELSFTGYFFDAAIPAFFGLFWIWGVLCYQTRGRWTQPPIKSQEKISYNYWQISKGVGVVTILLLFFFLSPVPRYQITLAAAGVLLLSRRMASNTTLGFIDWQLLVLFMGLFLTNAAFLKTDLAHDIVAWMQEHYFVTSGLAKLYAAGVVLSNIVSNVPAVMLLLPFAKTALQGSILALSSTLAGNLLLVGSISNLIVVSKAKEQGVLITWKEHFKSGLPITLGSILLSIVWLYLRHN